MDLKAKRVLVIEKYLQGKSPIQIFKETKDLNINKMFVYRTIKIYNKTGSVNKRYGGGHQIKATSAHMVRKVKRRLDRNPRRSARKLAQDLNISDRSVRRILKNKLNTKPYKIQEVHGLTDKQKKVRLNRAKQLKLRATNEGVENIVFSDEKIFTVEQSVNKQNDRVWVQDKSANTREHLRASRNQAPKSVMVWAGICASGRTPLVFIPENVKINAKNYQEHVLEKCLKRWAARHFKGQPWIFQQDSAPSHTARSTQTWLRENIPAFITPQEWPSNSPDLNPMDFCVWSILESRVNTRQFRSIDALKTALKREWRKIPQDVLRQAVYSFADRLQAVIRNKGGHIEK